MYRYEVEGICMRYDGTETRAQIDRGAEGNGLSTRELATLVWIFTEALRLRVHFDNEPSGETETAPPKPKTRTEEPKHADHCALRTRVGGSCNCGALWPKTWKKK